MKLFDYFGNIKNFFYPKNYINYSSSYLVGQQGAVWVNVDQPSELYNTIPQVKLIVDKKALMFSNMDLKLVDSSTGEEVGDEEFNKLINNPNPLQSMNDWLRQMKIQEQVYGNQFVYKNKPSNLTKYPVSLINISPRYMAPYLTGKVFNQTELNGIIAYYEYQQNGNEQKIRYEVDSVLYQRLNDIDNPIIGISPIQYLRFPISNIKAAYEYRNVIMTQKGAIGILSNESKDSMGAIPMTKEEKQRLERAYSNDYGIGAGQTKVHLTEASLKWQPMTYPTKDLMLFEEIDSNTLTLIDAYGLNANLFSIKDSTFENIKNSIVQTYQDTIIPEADQFTQALTKFLGVEKGKEIVADYSHISILQDNEKDGADLLQQRINSISQLSDKGIITNQMALEAINNMTGLQLVQPEQTAISDKINRLSPLVANNVLSTLTINEIRSIAGLPPVLNGDVLASEQRPVQDSQTA